MVGGCVNIDCLFRPASTRVYPGLISGPYSSGSHLVLCRVFPGLWDICFDGFGFARDFVRCCVEVRTGGLSSGRVSLLFVVLIFCVLLPTLVLVLLLSLDVGGSVMVVPLGVLVCSVLLHWLRVL